MSVPTLSEALTSPPVFTDGFGERYLAFDPDTDDPIEILAFNPTLAEAPDFAATVGGRVARVASARHALFVRVRRMDRPAANSVLLISDRVSGWRLSDVLQRAAENGFGLDISAAISLLRQLIPSVALFARHQRDLAVGTIAPERLLLTPQGRLVITEYVLGEALEKLALTREFLWARYRVAVASIPGEPREGPRSDVLGIGLVALQLLLSRRLQDDEFPSGLPTLLETATEVHGNVRKPLSPSLKDWLARTLQVDEPNALATPQEAQIAFEEMLAAERGYVTTPVLLDEFIKRYARLAGPPVEPLRIASAPATVAKIPSETPEQSQAASPIPSSMPAPSSATTPVGGPAAPAARARTSAAPSVPVAPAAHPTPAATSPPAAASAAPPVAAAPAVRTAPAAPAASAAPAVPAGPATLAVPAAPAEAEFPPETATPEFPPETDRPVFPSETAVPVVPPSLASWLPKAFAGVVVLAVLEAVALIWLWTRDTESLGRDGELLVQSRPTGAKVTLDEDELGMTPVTVRLSPGTYTLKVQTDKGEPRVIVVQIRAGVQTAQYLELQTGR